MSFVSGEWAWFDERDLALLLPGVIVPTRLKRHEYLTNWISTPRAVSLDVYAGADCEALFQHPFPPEFNPLIFGAFDSRARSSGSKRDSRGSMENQA